MSTRMTEALAPEALEPTQSHFANQDVPARTNPRTRELELLAEIADLLREPVPVRELLSVEEAAAWCSVSRATFDREIISHLRTVPAGRRLLVPVEELRRWWKRNAALRSA